MLTSLALIFLVGLALGGIFQKLKLPSLIGMILTGMILGPYLCNVLDKKILYIAPDFRQLALVIILTRAGLSLNLSDLKKVGRPAILMCFVPACFEVVGIVLLAPVFFSISYVDAAIIGAVLAAVSPAVIVPRMLKLMEEGYGTEKSIPQLILAGASVDDVFVIVLFTVFTSFASSGNASLLDFVTIPISVILGVAVGIFMGWALNTFFVSFHLRDSAKVLIILSCSFLFLALENLLKGIIPFSGLIAIMASATMIYQRNEGLAKRISAKYNKLWVAAEILLFVLVGATVDLSYAISAGLSAILIVFIGLLFRMIGVLCCLIKTNLSSKERLFTMIAYTPKATVQAAIGALPLTMGLSVGPLTLTIAVLSIILTAPLGAFFIDLLYKKLLTKKAQ